jgi:hypothetical protein
MNHVLYFSMTGTYYTKGKAFVVVNIGHPRRDELDGSRAFARNVTWQEGR